MKISCLHAKAHLIFHWCLYDKQSCYIASWLVHGHMTSNNKTVSRRMPWAGNITKTMTSNGKQFTVTREMLTAVARAWSERAVGGGLMLSPESRRVFQNLNLLLFLSSCITNHLMTGPLGNSEFYFPLISMFPLTSSWETLRFSETKLTVPLGTSY